jgi:hypothetical protein
LPGEAPKSTVAAKSRLAGVVVTYKPDDLSMANAQRNIGKGLCCAKRLGNTVKFWTLNPILS